MTSHRSYTRTVRQAVRRVVRDARAVGHAGESLQDVEREAYRLWGCMIRSTRPGARPLFSRRDIDRALLDPREEPPESAGKRPA